MGDDVIMNVMLYLYYDVTKQTYSLCCVLCVCVL